MCPYYMSIGMSYHDYWDGEARMPKYYREAEKIRRKNINAWLWILGRYGYEGHATVIANAFASSGTPPLKYPTEPFALTEDDVREREEREERERIEKLKSMVQNAVDKTRKLK